MKKGILFLMLALLLVGCGPKEKTPEEIYTDQASGVVMVLNQFYYSAELSNGEVIYFSGMKDGELEDISLNEDSIEKSFAFGTAFFVDEEGGLITNRHVVDPAIAPGEVKEYVRNLIAGLTAMTEFAQQQMIQQYNSLQEQIEDNTSLNYDEYFGLYATESEENDELREQQRRLKDDYNEAQEYIEMLRSIDVSELKIKTHSEIGIAYHDTYVTSPDDFKPCVVVKTDQSEDVDLAMIRLKDKTTPTDKFVFSLPKDEGKTFGPTADERGTIKLNQQLVLIGYNHGVQLAATREGIKAQLTTGNVSQQPDNDRVMYTIPVLTGSSGSPVLNKWGEVVAINFAGLNGTQSFNFGIPLKRIKQFMDQ